MAHELMHLLDDKYKLSKGENIVNDLKMPPKKSTKKTLRKEENIRKGIFVQCGKIFYNNNKEEIRIFQDLFPKGTYRFEKIWEEFNNETS